MIFEKVPNEPTGCHIRHQRVASLYSIFRNRLNNGVHCQGPVASGGLRKIDWAVCDGQDPRKTLFLGRESWYESNRRLCRLHRVEYAGHIKTSFDATDTLDTRYRHQLELIVKEHEGKLGSKKVCKSALEMASGNKLYRSRLSTVLLLSG